VFGEDGETYSKEVDDRMSQGIGNIVDVLTDDPPARRSPPPETAPPVTSSGRGRSPSPRRRR
jgi:hypothetical protein